MTSEPPAKRRLSTNTLYLILFAFMAVVVAAWNLNSYFGASLIFAGACASGYLILRVRQVIGRHPFSTHCESCGSMLQEHVGMPEKVCRNCRRTQSWVR